MVQAKTQQGTSQRTRSSAVCLYQEWLKHTSHSCEMWHIWLPPWEVDWKEINVGRKPCTDTSGYLCVWIQCHSLKDVGTNVGAVSPLLFWGILQYEEPCGGWCRGPITSWKLLQWMWQKAPTPLQSDAVLCGASLPSSFPFPLRRQRPGPLGWGIAKLKYEKHIWESVWELLMYVLVRMTYRTFDCIHLIVSLHRYIRYIWLYLCIAFNSFHLWYLFLNRDNIFPLLSTTPENMGGGLFGVNWLCDIFLKFHLWWVVHC